MSLTAHVCAGAAALGVQGSFETACVPQSVLERRGLGRKAALRAKAVMSLGLMCVLGDGALAREGALYVQAACAGVQCDSL